MAPKITVRSLLFSTLEPEELCISPHTEHCFQNSSRMYRQGELCLGRSGLSSHKEMMSKCSGILPRSLFLVIAAATLVLGPCFVNWYPNLRILEFSSSILAISISTAVPSCCLCEVSPEEKETFVYIWERSKWLCLSTGLQIMKGIPSLEILPWVLYLALSSFIEKFSTLWLQWLGPWAAEWLSHWGCLDSARVP